MHCIRVYTVKWWKEKQNISCLTLCKVGLDGRADKWTRSFVFIETSHILYLMCMLRCVDLSLTSFNHDNQFCHFINDLVLCQNSEKYNMSPWKWHANSFVCHPWGYFKLLSYFDTVSNSYITFIRCFYPKQPKMRNITENKSCPYLQSIKCALVHTQTVETDRCALVKCSCYVNKS